MTGPLPDALPLGADGHRRYLTLLFADLSGSTSLGELMEAEDYADVLAKLRALSREIIPRHGGLIARMQGDGLLALFGYPAAREDDGRRTTEAALELHAAVNALASRGPDGLPLTLHSGIHAGLVLMFDGDVERGRFDLLGNVPNIAARLSSLAGADDILVSEETLGPQAHFFTTGERMQMTLKGRAKPLAVYSVLGQAATGNRFEAMSRLGLCPFVGREQELRKLREHLRLAIAGTPQCVALTGGPGTGKTRLVEEVLRHAAAARCVVLRGYCESYLTAEPLQPFAQILRSLHAEHGTDLPEARDGTSALLALFGELAAARPLLLVIDDWQWADQASQQALDAVLTLQHPICVVLASRNGSDGVWPATSAVIDLMPLGEAEAAKAVRHLLRDADPFVVAEIHRYAGGIPLFIEELCHSAAAQGPQGLAGLRPGGRAWLNGLIESRVERLPGEEAALVRAAAVIGNVFPAWLLERITGHGENSPLVRGLAAQDFVFPGEQPGTLRFKHGITRDVVYEAVGLRDRRALHRNIARALQAQAEDAAADDLLEALAYHCAAGELPYEAAGYAERAGDKAMAVSALDRAQAQYGAALQALDTTAPLDRDQQLRWCAVAQKLGMACVFDPLALADGLATFERGVALARASGSLQALAHAEYWLGYLCYSKGLSRLAITHCEAALDSAVQVNDARLAAQVRATLGQTLLSACRYDRALGLLDVALDSKRSRARPGSKVAVGSAYALACKGYLLGDQGRFADVDECFAEALQLLGDMRHQVAASVRHWVSVVRQWQGRWEEALRAAEEAADIAEHVKSRQQLAMGRALAGHARWMIARDPQALQTMREATAWIEARKGGLAISLNHGWLVEGALAEGRIAEARRHAARLFLRARHDDRIGEALGCRALAHDAARAGDFLAAEHYLRLARRSADMRGSSHEHAANALCQAQVELDRGRPGEARRWLDTACTAFEAMRMRWHLERAGQVAARM